MTIHDIVSFGKLLDPFPARFACCGARPAGRTPLRQPVHVATVVRALELAPSESARVVDPAGDPFYTWEDRSKLRPREDERFIQGVRFRLRGPEAITPTELVGAEPGDR